MLVLLCFEMAAVAGMGGCGNGDGGGGGGGNRFWFNPLPFLEDEDEEEDDEEDQMNYIQIMRKRPNSREMGLMKRRKKQRQQMRQLCSYFSFIQSFKFTFVDAMFHCKFQALSCTKK